MENGRKVLLFYNPKAGNGLFKSNLDRIIEEFQKKNKIVIPIRAGKIGTLNEILKEIRQEEYCKIIAAGGDGTINTAINAMIQEQVDLPLAVFPAGTANDFAYYFDIPHDIERMVEIALEDNYTFIDVGVVNNEKCFVNVAALGFLVDVSQKTDPNVKNTLGVISYYLKGMMEVPNLRPIELTIESEEYSATEKVYFMLVMNGMSAGGFRRINAKGTINDGLLDVMLFKEMPIIEMPNLLINVMQGMHAENKNVISFQTSKLRITADQPIGTDVDGEKGCDLPLEIELLHNRFRVNTLRSDMEGSPW